MAKAKTSFLSVQQNAWQVMFIFSKSETPAIRMLKSRGVFLTLLLLFLLAGLSLHRIQGQILPQMGQRTKVQLVFREPRRPLRRALAHVTSLCRRHAVVEKIFRKRPLMQEDERWSINSKIRVRYGGVTA